MQLDKEMAAFELRQQNERTPPVVEAPKQKIIEPKTVKKDTKPKTLGGIVFELLFRSNSPIQLACMYLTFLYLFTQTAGLCLTWLINGAREAKGLEAIY
jgi:hypothetical protein